MLWEDMAVACLVPDPALRDALAAVFGIPPGAVLIVDAVEEIAAPAGDIQIVLERQRVRGDVALRLNVYLHDRDLTGRAAAQGQDLSLVKQLAALFACACLVGDASLSTESWLLVHPSGDVEQILLDPDQPDDTYRILSRRPLQPATSRPA